MADETDARKGPQEGKAGSETDKMNDNGNISAQNVCPFEFFSYFCALKIKY